MFYLLKTNCYWTIALAIANFAIINFFSSIVMDEYEYDMEPM
jgi:hypothetical protein